MPGDRGMHSQPVEGNKRCALRWPPVPCRYLHRHNGWPRKQSGAAARTGGCPAGRRSERGIDGQQGEAAEMGAMDRRVTRTRGNEAVCVGRGCPAEGGPDPWAWATHLQRRALQPARPRGRLLRLLPLRELAHVGNGNLRSSKRKAEGGLSGVEGDKHNTPRSWEGATPT